MCSAASQRGRDLHVGNAERLVDTDSPISVCSSALFWFVAFAPCAVFHGMEDSAYNLQISTLKTKDLEYSEPLRKCSGQERTNDVTAPNCSDNLASKSTRCGRRAMTLGRPRSLTYETSLG